MIMKAAVILFVTCLWSLGRCQVPMGELPTKVTAFVRHAATFAANELNTRSNGIYWNTLTHIQNATIEAVMGIMYRMEITLQESTCKNIPANNDANPTACPPKAGAMTMSCHVEVLDDPGSTPRYTLKNNHCVA
ncbi:uncharacterized protein LOC124132270 [Haliotis rufescens]|uniref:uncharacterized protein LOC124132270 n=1 Tax=Haliotis rufescens TaxID=6454 RepID=UPI001EB03FF2|nr:uncharacterized protein LOC124132270 [Haliotis rufescens]